MRSSSGVRPESHEEDVETGSFITGAPKSWISITVKEREVPACNFETIWLRCALRYGPRKPVGLMALGEQRPVRCSESGRLENAFNRK